MGTEKQSQKRTKIIDTTAREKGGRGSTFGSDKGSDGKRDYRVCDQRVIVALAKYVTKLERVEIRHRRGAGSYKHWLVLAVSPEREERSKLEREEVEAWALETGREMWEQVYDYTDKQGPVLDFQFKGTCNFAKKSGEQVLFEIACRCRVGDVASEPYDSDPDNPVGDFTNIVKEMRELRRIDTSHSHRLLESVIKPMEEISKLHEAGVARATETINWQRRLAHEELQQKLAENDLEKERLRLKTAEAIWNRTMNIFDGDLVDAAKSWFRTHGEGEIPDDLRRISVELFELHTFHQAMNMPDELEKQLSALWARSEQFASEEECALAWHAFHDDLVRHLPQYKARARTARQRRLLHKARARIALYPNAQPDDGIAW